MAWQDRSLDDISTTLLRGFEQRLIKLGHIKAGTRVTANSVMGVALREVAGQIDDLHAHLKWRGDQLFADTAEREQLERHASDVGILRKPATYATGSAVVTGANGVTIPAGTRLRAPSAPGMVWTSQADATIADGIATIALEALTAGAAANLATDTPMVLISPIANVDPQATVEAPGLAGGTDEEADARLLSRYLYRKRNPPRGGKTSDYVNWMLEVPGVVDAWGYPTTPDRGYVTGRFIMDPALGGPIPDEALRLAVQAYVDGHENPITGLPEGRPAGMVFNSVAVVAQAINVTVALGSDTPAIRTAVTNELRAQLLLDGKPGQLVEGAPVVFVRESRLREAVSRAAGETYHRISAPAADVALAVNAYPVLGAVTWEAY